MLDSLAHGRVLKSVEDGVIYMVIVVVCVFYGSYSDSVYDVKMWLEIIVNEQDGGPLTERRLSSWNSH